MKPLFCGEEEAAAALEEFLVLNSKCSWLSLDDEGDAVVEGVERASLIGDMAGNWGGGAAIAVTGVGAVVTDSREDVDGSGAGPQLGTLHRIPVSGGGRMPVNCDGGGGCGGGEAICTCFFSGDGCGGPNVTDADDVAGAAEEEEEEEDAPCCEGGGAVHVRSGGAGGLIFGMSR